MNWSTICLKFLVLLIVSPFLSVHAENSCTIQGSIIGVESQDNQVRFQLSGTIELSTTIQRDGKPSRQQVIWKLPDTPITISKWESPPPGEFPQLVNVLTAARNEGHTVIGTVEHPTLRFSKEGDVIAIDGTRASLRGLLSAVKVKPKVIGNERTFSRDDAVALAGDDAVFKQLKTVPYYHEGQHQGLRLFSVTPGSLWHEIGIENGDVLTEVLEGGDTPIDIRRDFQSVFKKLVDSGVILIRMKRETGGEEVEIVLRVVG